MSLFDTGLYYIIFIFYINYKPFFTLHYIYIPYYYTIHIYLHYLLCSILYPYYPIQTLDGEMQKLVYDNYNKFITATETIRTMKADVYSMDSDMDAVKYVHTTVYILCLNVTMCVCIVHINVCTLPLTVLLLLPLLLLPLLLLSVLLLPLTPLPLLSLILPLLLLV